MPQPTCLLDLLGQVCLQTSKVDKLVPGGLWIKTAPDGTDNQSQPCGPLVAMISISEPYTFRCLVTHKFSGLG